MRARQTAYAPSDRKRRLRSGLLLLCFLLPAPLAAEHPLVENSPFLPPGFGQKPETPPPPTPSQGPLANLIEFRSVVRLNEEWLFSLYNRQERRNVWVAMGEPHAQYRILDFDPEANRLNLTFNGQTEWLPIKAAGAATAAAPQTQTPVLRAPGVQQQRTAQDQRPALNRRRVPAREPVEVPRRTTTPGN